MAIREVSEYNYFFFLRFKVISHPHKHYETNCYDMELSKVSKHKLHIY